MSILSKIKNDNKIEFKKDTHQYFDPEGNEYQSLSKVLELIKMPFDKQGMSYNVAKSRAGWHTATEDEVIIEQEKVLKEWDDLNKESIDVGHSIHDGVEKYLETGSTDPALMNVAKMVSDMILFHNDYITEEPLYIEKYMIAGTPDLIAARQKTDESLIDIYDYKTNISKGIQFDSMKRKDGKLKHYNSKFLPPFDKIEECNYFYYCLQLSAYAYMLEQTYKMNIGKLMIIFIGKENDESNDYNIQPFPVPYMREEIIRLFDHSTNVKPITKKGEIVWD